MPRRRWEVGTKRRGIPRGVGRGAGWMRREVEGVRGREMCVGEGGAGAATAIAVEMR